MASAFKLPELGENVESGTVARVLVSEGDTIEKEQSVIELETEKAALEVPCDVSGKILRILVEEGDEVKVGQKILEVDEQAEGEKKVTAPAKKVSESREEETEVKESKEEQKAEVSEKTVTAAEKKERKKSGKVVEIKLPELGENVESGTVAKLLVSPGDKINRDQNFIELETEKAALEVPCEASGVVKEILVNEGDEVKVGQTILTLTAEEEAAAAEIPEAEQEVKEKKPPAKPAPERAEEPVIPVTGPSAEERKPAAREVEFEEKPAPAAPSVRRFAREIGIDIHQVPGSGPGGRISSDDVKNYSKTLHRQQAASRALLRGVEPEPLPDFAKWGTIERQPMSQVREKTATHLAYAWATVAHVSQFDKADITELEKFRKHYGQKAETAGGKLTTTAILLKVAASALKKFPQFNCSIDMQKKEIIYKKYYNMGVAVDTDRGLLVPVLKNVDRKNIIDLSVELTEVARKAREKKLTLEEMQGSNFSVSNLGGIGGTAFTPIVHSPDVAILGVSRAKMEPIYAGGEFRPRLMLPLSLSYDHRIIDGADAARFLRWICEALEQPFLIPLEG